MRIIKNFKFIIYRALNCLTLRKLFWNPKKSYLSSPSNLFPPQVRFWPIYILHWQKVSIVAYISLPGNKETCFGILDTMAFQPTFYSIWLDLYRASFSHLFRRLYLRCQKSLYRNKNSFGILDL